MRPTLEEKKRNMINYHLKARGIKDKNVLKAFEEVPREKFVDYGMERMAYDDCALPIGHHVTISQPYIVALMSELLELKNDYTVLDIGSGSGYQAAIFSRICKKVIALERVKPLVDKSVRVFRDLGYKNIEVIHMDGSKGYKEYSPYDGINIAAATNQPEDEVLKQLKKGAKLVFPENRGNYQKLTVIERVEDGFDKTYHGGVHFVPLIKD